MDDLHRFNIPHVATVESGAGGMPRLSIRAGGATAEIYLQGAHVTAYSTPAGRPLLFLSRSSLFQPGKAIRGGVPLIFPWFGPNASDPKLPAHGFARTLPWSLESVEQHGTEVVAQFSLAPSAPTRSLWPREFALNYTVRVGATLQLALAVRNTGRQPFTFEEALHTYLAVDDVRQVSIEGLAGRPYLDKMQKGRRIVEGAEPIRIVGETDRVYLATADAVHVKAASGKTLSVSKTGSGATVVWNPWVAKSKSMADFGDEEWPGMLCIETANCAQEAVTLEPGQEHTMSATLAG